MFIYTLKRGNPIDRLKNHAIAAEKLITASNCAFTNFVILERKGTYLQNAEDGTDKEILSRMKLQGIVINIT